MTYISLALVLLFVSMGNPERPANRQEQFPKLDGPYLGQQPPRTKPVLFAPGIVSTDLHDDFSPAFTPDGKEVFFRCLGNRKMIILHSKLEFGQWSRPQVASFSGGSGDLGVLLSHDGNKLFFSSDRPASASDTTGDLDIFGVDRTTDGWGEPYCLPLLDSGAGDIFGCSIDSEGSIYYYARLPKGTGGYDLYRSRQVDGIYSKGELLTEQINTGRDETCPCIARDGSFLIYSSNGGPTGNEGSGLYVTFLKPDLSWTEPVNLSKHLGMTVPAKFPGLSPDGKYLFFVVPESKEANRRLGRLWDVDDLRGAEPREGGGNIYWVDVSVLNSLRPGR